MSNIKFDDCGRAWVSENDFFAYVEKTKRSGDYYKESVDFVYYYNSFGCLLARYNRAFNFGELF